MILDAAAVFALDVAALSAISKIVRKLPLAA
jgi:hypothetical protein